MSSNVLLENTYMGQWIHKDTAELNLHISVMHFLKLRLLSRNCIDLKALQPNALSNPGEASPLGKCFIPPKALKLKLP